jgi:hypothetical protein
MHARLRVASALLVFALIGCGDRRPAAGLGNTAPAEPGADPVTVLARLAQAIDADDGVALAALVHPARGVRLWFTPGAGYAVLATLAPGDTRPPSARLAAARDQDPTGYWITSYWPSVRAGIRDGLPRLDRDPADPWAPIYGTCEEDGGPGPPRYRAYLVGGVDDANLQAFDLAGAGEVDPAEVQRDLVRFHHWGLEAYLARHEGTWWLVHLVVVDVCSA